MKITIILLTTRALPEEHIQHKNKNVHSIIHSFIWQDLKKIFENSKMQNHLFLLKKSAIMQLE